MIETRDGSEQVIKSRRSGIRGTRYVDELLQIGMNDDPATAPGLPSETPAGYSCDALRRIVAEEFPTPGRQARLLPGHEKTQDKKRRKPREQAAVPHFPFPGQDTFRWSPDRRSEGASWSHSAFSVLALA